MGERWVWLERTVRASASLEVAVSAIFADLAFAVGGDAEAGSAVGRLEAQLMVNDIAEAGVAGRSQGGEGDRLNNHFGLRRSPVVGETGATERFGRNHGLC